MVFLVQVTLPQKNNLMGHTMTIGALQMTRQHRVR